MPGLPMEVQHTRQPDKDNGEQLHILQFQELYYSKQVYRCLVSGHIACGHGSAHTACALDIAYNQTPLPLHICKASDHNCTISIQLH